MSAPQIPGYTFVERLGSGGFAEVFLYEQEWPRQRVAVKVVRPDLTLTEREKTLFTAEANAMARLADHPYIVSVITAGVTVDDRDGSGGRPYLVMRYCPPPDLGVRVRQQPMSVSEALSTGIKLASAIETAHRSGILHRDVKPSNVLVTTYNEPALTDFGIAGHMHEVAADDEVRISYPWAAPELLDGRSNGSVASDVYSLGATIWNLLVGRSPFSVPNGDNGSRALTTRILHAAPPATHRPDVPPALDRLLQQCLAKDPDHRPQSALELARGLQRVESQTGFSRTAVAVEGDPATGGRDLVPVGPGVRNADPDATHVKPMTVAGPSAPRPPGGPRPPASTPAPERRGRGLWTAAGAVVVVALVATLALRGGAVDREPTADPSPTGGHTPLDVAPDAPDRAPELEGTRHADGTVRFSWRSPDPLQEGDSWQWTREDTGDRDRTRRRSHVVASAGRVCLEVRLVRGTLSSPPARTCVD